MIEKITTESKKDKSLKKHISFSKISFIIFILSLVFYLYMKIYHGSGGDFFMFFFGFIFYTPYVAYLILHTLFIHIFYEKILRFNIAAFALIFIVAILNYTGFSYPKVSYLTKAEQIDIGLEKGYLYTICYDNGWYGDKEKECPYTLKKLKEEYPQCFTDERPDDCKLYQYRKNYSLHFGNLFGFTPIATIYSKELIKLDKKMYPNQYYNIYPNLSASYIFGNADNVFKKIFNFKE
jgi:hypothetical protein